MIGGILQYELLHFISVKCYNYKQHISHLYNILYMFCYICYIAKRNLDAVDVTKQEEIEAERARRRRANDVKDEQMI